MFKSVEEYAAALWLICTGNFVCKPSVTTYLYSN